MMEERSKAVLVVYLALVLDNILLTVVVPVIPVFLFQNEHPSTGTLQSSEHSADLNYDGFSDFHSIHLHFPLVPSQKVLNLWERKYNRLPSYELEITPSPLDKDALLKSGEEFHNISLEADKMSTENGRVGFLFSSKAFVQLIANPAVGYATHKLGYHLPFISGSATLLLSAIIFSSSSSYFWLLLARSLQGMASACISVAGMGLVAQMYSEEKQRSRVMGYVLGGIAVGVLVGYPLGGFLFDFVGESAPFILISFATGILLAYQIIHFNQEVNFNNSDDESDVECNEEDEAPLTYLQLLSNPRVLVVTGSVWFSTTAMALLEPCLPIWLMDNIKPPKWQLGTVFIPDSLGYFIGTNCFAIPALKFGRHRLAILAMIIVGVSAMTIPLARSMLDLVLPHFFLGLGIGMVDSALMPLLAKFVDDTDGKSSGYGSMYAIAQTAVCLAYGLGPLVGGHLATHFGFPELMCTVGICNLLYSPLLLILVYEFKNPILIRRNPRDYNQFEDNENH